MNNTRNVPGDCFSYFIFYFFIPRSSTAFSGVHASQERIDDTSMLTSCHNASRIRIHTRHRFNIARIFSVRA
jgi:hypothetical protein